MPLSLKFPRASFTTDGVPEIDDEQFPEWCLRVFDDEVVWFDVAVGDVLGM